MALDASREIQTMEGTGVNRQVTFEMYAMRGLLPGALSLAARRTAKVRSIDEHLVPEVPAQSLPTSVRDACPEVPAREVGSAVRQYTRRSLRRARRAVQQRAEKRSENKRILERELERYEMELVSRITLARQKRALDYMSEARESHQHLRELQRQERLAYAKESRVRRRWHYLRDHVVYVLRIKARRSVERWIEERRVRRVIAKQLLDNVLRSSLRTTVDHLASTLISPFCGRVATEALLVGPPPPVPMTCSVTVRHTYAVCGTGAINRTTKRGGRPRYQAGRVGKGKKRRHVARATIATTSFAASPDQFSSLRLGSVARQSGVSGRTASRCASRPRSRMRGSWCVRPKSAGSTLRILRPEELSVVAPGTAASAKVVIAQPQTVDKQRFELVYRGPTVDESTIDEADLDLPGISLGPVLTVRFPSDLRNKAKFHGPKPQSATKYNTARHASRHTFVVPRKNLTTSLDSKRATTRPVQISPMASQRGRPATTTAAVTTRCETTYDASLVKARSAVYETGIRRIARLNNRACQRQAAVATSTDAVERSSALIDAVFECNSA